MATPGEVLRGLAERERLHPHLVNPVDPLACICHWKGADYTDRFCTTRATGEDRLCDECRAHVNHHYKEVSDED